MGSMGCLGVHLVALKLLLIAYYGARACLLPLIPAHFKGIGFNTEEQNLIVLVVPPLTILGPIIFGFLADFIRRHKKLVTAFAVLMMCLSATVLLMIPPIYRPTPHPPKLSLLCSDTGSAIQVENCYDSCDVMPRHSNLKTLTIRNCHTQCNITYPHMCFNRNGEPNGCTVLNPFAEFGDITISSVLRRYSEQKENNACIYPLLQFYSEDKEYTSLKCLNHDDCLLICDVLEVNVTTPAFRYSVCDTDMSQVIFRKWLYIGFLALTETFVFSVAALLDSMVLRLLRRENDGYGVQLLFGLLSMGLFGPLCGYLIYSETGLFGQSELYPPLMACDILLLIAAGLSLSLPNPMSIEYNAAKVTLSRPMRIAAGLTAAVFLGILYGGLSWHIIPTQGPPYHIEGVSGAILGVLLVPFTYKAMEVFGTGYLLSVCFACYCIRYVVYLLASEFLWIPLLMGFMEAFTLWVPLTILVLLMNQSTAYWHSLILGLLYSMHFGVGRSCGVALFYHLSLWLGDDKSLKLGSIMSAVFALVTLIFYWAWVRQRMARGFRYHDVPENVNFGYDDDTLLRKK